jgi:acetoin utilization protein AcuC
MSGSVGLVDCREAAIYELSETHPFTPDRFLLAFDLIEAYGLDRLPNVHRVHCRPATDEELGLIHTAEFIDATKRAGHGESGSWGRFGYSPEGMPGDNPIFPNMHEAASLVAGATLDVAREVLEGTADHGFNPTGGLHHAMDSRASGFCIYDDPAMAIEWLLREGIERVAYVDVDVHHGDGVQAAFYSDARVLTASIHQYGMWFFPGTGDRHETGSEDAIGTVVNVPLHAGIRDEEWLGLVRTEILPKVREFQPQVLVTELGADTHATDPIGGLSLSTRAYEEAAHELHMLAHQTCAGRWIATGGGGYSLTATPRAWTLYFAEMCGVEVPDELPDEWAEMMRERFGRQAPARLRDGST